MSEGMKQFVAAVFCFTIAGLIALGIMTYAEEQARITAELEAKGCKIIWSESSRYVSGYDNGQRVSLRVPGFDLWKCPGQPLFKR